MPRVGRTIDCMAVAQAGHYIPDGYGPIPVHIFLNNVIASENSITNGSYFNIVRLFVTVLFSFAIYPFSWKCWVSVSYGYDHCSQ